MFVELNQRPSFLQFRHGHQAEPYRRTLSEKNFEFIATQQQVPIDTERLILRSETGLSLFRYRRDKLVRDWREGRLRRGCCMIIFDMDGVCRYPSRLIHRFNRIVDEQ